MKCRELTEISTLTGASFAGASFATLAIPEFAEAFGCCGIDIFVSNNFVGGNKKADQPL